MIDPKLGLIIRYKSYDLRRRYSNDLRERIDVNTDVYNINGKCFSKPREDAEPHRKSQNVSKNGYTQKSESIDHQK